MKPYTLFCFAAVMLILLFLAINKSKLSPREVPTVTIKAPTNTVFYDNAVVFEQPINHYLFADAQGWQIGPPGTIGSNTVVRVLSFRINHGISQRIVVEKSVAGAPWEEVFCATNTSDPKLIP